MAWLGRILAGVIVAAVSIFITRYLDSAPIGCEKWNVDIARLDTITTANSKYTQQDVVFSNISGSTIDSVKFWIMSAENSFDISPKSSIVAHNADGHFVEKDTSPVGGAPAALVEVPRVVKDEIVTIEMKLEQHTQTKPEWEVSDNESSCKGP